MAIPQPARAHPFLIPTALLPLAALALATIAAFLFAYRSEPTALASLWTPCSSSSSSSSSHPLPTPLCFAIHFFQAAHAAPRPRLEQAMIVALLAALATITAVESAQVRRRQAESLARTEETAKREEPGPATRRRRPRELSLAIVSHLTVPWLLYNLALGALAWQAIIIPAFLHRRSRRPRQPRNTRAGAGTDAAPAPSLAIPLSIAIGLLVPAANMLQHPTAPLPILLFLLFPLWTSLAHRLLLLLLFPLNPGRLRSKTAAFALPILASALAHVALLFHLFSSPAAAAPLPTTTQAAIRLLELDHAAIYLAALYWILLEAGIRAVLAALTTTVLLGPGAGLCVGWLYRAEEQEEEEEPTTTTMTTMMTETGRRKGGKATTGTFFGGPPA